MALKTPVIFVHKEFYDNDRLDTFFNLFANYDEDSFMKMDIRNLLKKPPENSKEYMEAKQNLEKSCKSFIKRCENKSLDAEDNLPEIEKYQKYTKRLEWYKSIYEKERLNVESIEQKRTQEYELYHYNLERLQKEVDKWKQRSM